MQFIPKGPNIPSQLLQAHEEGRVVFFCGAGISYPARLPGFQGLVDRIYDEVGTKRTPIEQAAYGNGQFDATLDLLERRLPGQRSAVRDALTNILRPCLSCEGATDTHEALLVLGRTHGDAIRLVTTNFDRIFAHVAKLKKLRVPSYRAPMLPLPKSSRWDGIVYLHGLLPSTTNRRRLDQLVLTSGDFGLAYLTERWAARFVSELFRNYVVCFVGYSINDPVMRYMMDALAADRMLGETIPQAYALADCEPGQEELKEIEWSAKGVTPILYQVPSGSSDHSGLHKSLKVWADTYRDGSLGKERIVVDHAMARPASSSPQDDFVERLLWALSDRSGVPASRFADFEPVPELAWLHVLCQERYKHEDLVRFGLYTGQHADRNLTFSLLRRPAEHIRAPWMALASHGDDDARWDKIMEHLARWLTRHLGDPSLLIWAAQRGGQVNGRFQHMIEQRLDHLDRLTREGATDELDRIKANAPNAIPEASLRAFWRLMFAGRVKSSRLEYSLYDCEKQIKRDGLTASARFGVRQALTPKIILRDLRYWGLEEGHEPDEPSTRQGRLNWDLVLATDHSKTVLGTVSRTPEWKRALPDLFEDLQQLLRDALDIMRELGEADDNGIRWIIELPTISPHWQTRDLHDWAVLAELIRDSWLAIQSAYPIRASEIAKAWFASPHMTFKRLALFAASQNGTVDTNEWVDWLLSDNHRLLWSVLTKRETLRLLVLQGAQLTAQTLTRLEQAILDGPPRVATDGEQDQGSESQVHKRCESR
jgi:hypothetical protein